MPTTVPGTVVTQTMSPHAVKQSIYEISSVQLHPLGTRLEVGERVFHYAKAGATALDPGKMNDAPAPVANHRNIAVAAAASVGSNVVRVTLGATQAVANEYAEGTLNVVSGATNAYAAYKIKSHPTIAASGSGNITLYDPLQVALTTSARVTLRKNPWKDVVVSPTTVTSTPVGVALVSVTANYYFWCQTWGPCTCLIGAGPPSIGAALMRSAATAGALITATAGNPIVGWLMSAEAAADYGLVFLTIAP